MLTGKQTAIAALMLLGAIVCTTEAHANGPNHWKLTVTNATTINFDDFHATFAGTGGSIKNAVLKMDPHGTGVPMGMANMVWVTWPVGDWITPGMTFQVNFDTDFAPIDLVGGELTKGGDVIATFGGDGEVMTPGGPIGRIDFHLIPAPGSALPLIAGSLFLARRRR